MTTKYAPIGFLVWNAERDIPTFRHETFERALAEAERLRDLHPTQHFWVMAPVTPGNAKSAQAFSEGRQEGLAQAHREIMLAEANADRNGEKVFALENRLRQLEPIQNKSRAFQAIVADCLLWFDGFRAAFALRDGWERPNVPEREKLCELNRALQQIMPADALDADEIPF